MKNKHLKLKKVLSALLLTGTVCTLCACSRLSQIEIPPLPTPKPAQAELTPGPTALPPVPTQLPAPEFTFTPAATLPPAPTFVPAATPMATPEPTPLPQQEDPNIPHLYLQNATYPESMPQYGIANLQGEIYTDKGVIAQVCGRIYNNDTGENEQICMYYPYESFFSLAGTVNAKLIFGVLDPGHYTYIVSAIAENNSYTNGEEVLIEHGFEIYYP